MLPTLLVILTVAVPYWFPLRCWIGRWGTTSSDLTRVMVGDGLIVDQTFAYTMAGPGTENRVHKELPVGTSSSGKFVVSRTGHTYDVEPDVKSEIPQFSKGLLTYF
jgi:hypothetical protein